MYFVFFPSIEKCNCISKNKFFFPKSNIFSDIVGESVIFEAIHVNNVAFGRFRNQIFNHVLHLQQETVQFGRPQGSLYRAFITFFCQFWRFLLIEDVSFGIWDNDAKHEQKNDPEAHLSRIGKIQLRPKAAKAREQRRKALVTCFSVHSLHTALQAHS